MAAKSSNTLTKYNGKAKNNKVNTKKTTQNNRKNTTKSSSSSKNKAKEKEIEVPYKEKSPVDEKGRAVYHDEIVFATSVGIAILLFMSNFDMTGVAGKAVNKFLFGLFGIPAYIAPLVVIGVVLVYLSNRNSIFAVRKCVCSVGFLVTVCAVIQLANYEDSMKLGEIYNSSSNNRDGGGLIGGMVCKLLCSLFDKGGALVILIICALVFTIVITEKLFIKAANNFIKTIPEKIRSYNDRYIEEQYEECDEEIRRVPDIIDAEEIKPLQTGTRRKAQTFTFIREEDVVKEENELKDIIDVSAELKEEAKPINVNNNFEIDNGEIFEKELNEKFGDARNNGELDIKHLADELINGKVSDDKSEIIGSVAGSNIKDVIETFEEDEDTKQMSIPKNPEVVNSIGDSEKADEKKKTEETAKEGTAKITKAKKYKFPSTSILTAPDKSNSASDMKEHQETARKLQATFESFGVGVTLTNVSCGPAVTRYEVQPDQGVKVSKITNLADDIKLNLAAADIRIEAPIPGKAAVGIEVPNKGSNATVMLRELIESKEFKKNKSSLAFAVGKDISGQVVVADIAKMPHLLIAGQTGSGKSVCINTLIMSILYKAHPDDVKLIMIDPKVVELSVYNGIPHLLIPVVTDPKKASGALNWAVAEMTERYAKFAELGVRDISSFNERVTSVEGNDIERYQKLPQIVIIVDELADLMMVAPGEVEDAICRLAQMARAAGLHLIIATQRPSVNVITGLIKANVPSRIAFSVASAIDSRTILDGGGAEKLLGKGDMLFFPSGYPKPVRVQGAFITDKEVGEVVDFLSKQEFDSGYDETIDIKINETVVATVNAETMGTKPENGKDDYFAEAGKFIIEKDKASIGMLQRVYKIGFNRAARIMDQLCEAGVVGPEEGTKPRKVIMTKEEFDTYIEECL